MSEQETATGKRTPRQWPVGRASEIGPGQRRIVEVKGRSVGVFNVNGTFVAALNVCPHELAPVCRGRVGGTTLPSPPGEYRWGRDGEILACPWHGWDYDLLTGKALADPRVRLRLYPVTVEDDTLFVTM
jgi:3-phenylpropionate/trans-cinnamate dioxygenase ferredoxin subunit